MSDRPTIKNCKKSLIFVLKFLISSIKDMIPSKKHSKEYYYPFKKKLINKVKKNKGGNSYHWYDY
jgi:hypothetical protein